MMTTGDKPTTAINTTINKEKNLNRSTKILFFLHQIMIIRVRNWEKIQTVQKFHNYFCNMKVHNGIVLKSFKKIISKGNPLDRVVFL